MKTTSLRSPATVAAWLLAAGAALLLLGMTVGSTGWEPLRDETRAGLTILWEIRLPRTLGAWLAGALLGPLILPPLREAESQAAVFGHQWWTS